MSENLLLNSQKNEIYELIAESYLEPSDFEWDGVGSHNNKQMIVSRLKYFNTPYFFQFDFRENRHYAIFSPGKQTRLEEEFSGSWALQKAQVRGWLEYLKKEIEQPDLWGNIKKYHFKTKPEITDQQDVPFTYLEVARIISGINEIGIFLKEMYKTQLDIGLLDKKLDFLKELAKTQTRKQWIYYCIGVLTAIISNIDTPAEEIIIIWHRIQNILAGIVSKLPK